MSTVQTNVRVPTGDKPIMRAIAARLRADARFHDRLQALLAEEPSPALEARVARLEEQVRSLIDRAGGGRMPSAPDPSRARPANGGPDGDGSRPASHLNAD